MLLLRLEITITNLYGSSSSKMVIFLVLHLWCVDILALCETKIMDASNYLMADCLYREKFIYPLSSSPLSFKNHTSNINSNVTVNIFNLVSLCLFIFNGLLSPGHISNVAV